MTIRASIRAAIAVTTIRFWGFCGELTQFKGSEPVWIVDFAIRFVRDSGLWCLGSTFSSESQHFMLGFPLLCVISS